MADNLYDPDNPLPEPAMVARRWLTFLSTLALMGLLGWCIHRSPDSEIKPIAFGIMGLMLANWCFYYGGASANDLAGLIQAAKLALTFGPTKTIPKLPPLKSAPPAPVEVASPVDPQRDLEGTPFK